jgi:hypothetical protein
MNPCECCALAELKPRSGLIFAGCRGCEARSLAKSPSFWEAAKAEAMTPAYRDALQQIAGEEWRELHAQVKRWGEILEANP